MPRDIDQFISGNLLKGDPRRIDAQGFIMSGDREQMDTGFSENFAASVGSVVDEDTTISGFLSGWGAQNIPGTVGHEIYGGRNAELEQMHKRGEIPDEVWEGFQYSGALHAGPRGGIGTNWDGMARFLQANGVDIRTNEQLEEDIRPTLKRRRDYMESVRQKSGFAGDIGMFLGTFAGATLDPINIAASAYGGATAMRGATAIRNAFKMGGREALINVQAEAVIQPLVMSFKESIDSPYGAADALTNIAAAAVFGFGLGGLMSVPSGLKIRKLNAVAKDIRENGATIADVKDALGSLVGAVKVREDGQITINTTAPIKGYHGTDVDIDELRTGGLGAHIALDPAAAAGYPYPMDFDTKRVYEADIAAGKFLRIPDTGGDHRQAEEVIAALIGAGVLPKGFGKGLNKKLFKGLDNEEKLEVSAARGEEKGLEEFPDGLEWDDLSDKFHKNNETALVEVKEHFKSKGYKGFIYQGTREGAGEGTSLVVFDPEHISIGQSLTPGEAKDLPAAIEDIQQYLDEIKDTPAITAHEHEAGVKAAEDMLNDPAPKRLLIEEEIVEQTVESQMANVDAFWEQKAIDDPDGIFVVTPEEDFMGFATGHTTAARFVGDVEDYGGGPVTRAEQPSYGKLLPPGQYTYKEINDIFKDYDKKINGVIDCLRKGG